MRESVKSVCVVVFMFATITAAIGWADGIANVPDWVRSFMKYGCTLLSVFALATLLVIHLRPDEVPDYLAMRVGSYYNRGGFCFGVLPVTDSGICVLEVYFQNQHTGCCVGRVALRPGRNFFLGRADIEPVAVEIECGPAAFGVARVPIAVLHPLQGRRQRFEVGASVDYHSGRERQVRFRDGVFLRTNSQFGNAFGNGLMVAGAMAGMIEYSRPAEVEIILPEEVAEDLVGLAAKASVETLWQLGDPMLTVGHG